MALFGTDGIRGLANGESLTAEIAKEMGKTKTKAKDLDI